MIPLRPPLAHDGESVAKAVPMCAQTDSSANDATLRRSAIDFLSMSFPPGVAGVGVRR
jgi:hypothetical protein